MMLIAHASDLVHMQIFIYIGVVHVKCPSQKSIAVWLSLPFRSDWLAFMRTTVWDTTTTTTTTPSIPSPEMHRQSDFDFGARTHTHTRETAAQQQQHQQDNTKHSYARNKAHNAQ